jgi:hypothetical protein
VQFIVTTHSPLPILGASTDKKPVILTVERNPKQGITVQRKEDDFDIRQLNPSSLLTSPIFGLQTLFARNAKPDDIIASNDFKDAVKKSFKKFDKKSGRNMNIKMNFRMMNSLQKFEKR